MAEMAAEVTIFATLAGSALSAMVAVIVERTRTKGNVQIASTEKPSETQAAINKAVSEIVEHYTKALQRSEEREMVFEEREEELNNDIRALRETIEEQTSKLSDTMKALDETKTQLDSALLLIEKQTRQIETLQSMVREAGQSTVSAIFGTAAVSS